MLGPVGEGCVLAKHDARAAVLDAVLEVVLRGPPRERDEDGAAPLRRPVEKGGLDAVVEDGGESLARLEPEAARESRCALAELGLGDAGESLGARLAFRRGEQGESEVHGASAACAIASTIGW